MRFFIKLIAIVLVLSALIYTAGVLLPVEHSVSRSIPLSHNITTVWKTIVDYPAMTEWNPNTKSVKQLKNSAAGNQVWRFDDNRGYYMEIEDIERKAPSTLVSRIVKTNCPFGGDWVFELREAKTGTVLTITENGTISNPVLRVLFRYILGYDKGIAMYQKALEKRLDSPSKTQ